MATRQNMRAVPRNDGGLLGTHLRMQDFGGANNWMKKIYTVVGSEASLDPSQMFFNEYTTILIHDLNILMSKDVLFGCVHIECECVLVSTRTRAALYLHIKLAGASSTPIFSECC